MFEVSIKTRFSAAHHLKGYKGPCSSAHGHNWEIEVSVRGSELDKTGILVDFRKLKKVLRETVAVLDHTDLNKLPEFGKSNPTSENIARLVYLKISKKLNTKTCRIAKVAVQESPDSKAVYWEEPGEKGAPSRC